MSSTVAVERRPNRAGERRRLQMLEAAEQLVREHGHQNVTMQMIAEAVGVSQPAVNHHFASRDHLFVEVLRYRDEHAPEFDAADSLEALLLAASNSQKSPHLAALFADYSSRAVHPDNPAHAFFAERNQSGLDELAAALRSRAARARTPLSGNAERLAVLLMTLSDGLLVRWLIDRELDMAAELSFAVESLSIPPAPFAL